MSFLDSDVIDQQKDKKQEERDRNVQYNLTPIKTLKQDDLDIEGMLRDVEEIERKIRKTIN